MASLNIPEITAVPIEDPLPHDPSEETGDGQTPFPPLLLNIGFVVGLLLAVACFAIAAWYLVSFLLFGTETLQQIVPTLTPDNNQPLAAHAYISRVLLQSCGLAVGMAFGFLGFSLFLLGVRGNIAASGAAGASISLQVARLSPGAFVMLCSTILVALCALQEVSLSTGSSVLASDPALSADTIGSSVANHIAGIGAVSENGSTDLYNLTIEPAAPGTAR